MGTNEVDQDRATQGYTKDSVLVGKVDSSMAAEDGHCEINDNYSVM